MAASPDPAVILKVGAPPIKLSATGTTPLVNLRSALKVCPTPGFDCTENTSLRPKSLTVSMT